MRTFFAFVLIAGSLLFGGTVWAQSYEYKATFTFSRYVTNCNVDTGWKSTRAAAADAAFAQVQACAAAAPVATCVAKTASASGANGYRMPVEKGAWSDAAYQFISHLYISNRDAACAETDTPETRSIVFSTRQVTCQAGAPLTKTFFYAWATDNTDNPANFVPSTVVTPPTQYCDGSCLFGYSDTSSAEVDEQPSPNQYYAVYATHNYGGAGQACTTQTPDPGQSETPDGGTGTGGGTGDGTGTGGTGDGTGDGTGGDTGTGTGTGDTGGTGGTGDTGGTGGGGGGTGDTGGSNDTPPTQEVDENGNPIGGSGGTGTTDPTDPSGGGTGGTGGDGLGDMLCDAFPTIFACQKMGGAGGPTAVPDREIGVSVITPTTAFGPTPDSSCPSPTTIQTVAGPVSWDWDGFCQFADGIRPVILALAWLSAGLSTFLFLRR